MTGIKEHCTYTCGPYKGYFGKAELDEDSFHGEVVGMRDVVTFVGRNPVELKKAFRDSVNDYLEFCKSRGEAPEKPFSGKFLVRIAPELHRNLSTIAGLSGKSLNQLVGETLAHAAETPGVKDRTIPLYSTSQDSTSQATAMRRSNPSKKQRRRA